MYIEMYSFSLVFSIANYLRYGSCLCTLIVSHASNVIPCLLSARTELHVMCKVFGLKEDIFPPCTQ